MPSAHAAQWDKLAGTRRERSSLTFPSDSCHEAILLRRMLLRTAASWAITSPLPSPFPKAWCPSSQSMSDTEPPHGGYDSPEPKSRRRCCRCSKHKNHTRPLIPPRTPWGSCRPCPKHSLRAAQASQHLLLSGDAKDRRTHAPTPNAARRTLVCNTDTSDFPRL